MPIAITLTITKGKLKNRQFHYDKKEALVLGRNDDCAIVFPENTVSRYHCLMDIAPPSIMVRDFGSLNGTYLNGQKIGQRPEGMSFEEARKQRTNEFSVKSGDRIGFGQDCEITVDIQIPQYCANCLCEIKSISHKDKAGRLLCDDCFNARQNGAQKQVKCNICGNILRENEKKLMICADCFKTPEKALNYLLKRAQGGDNNLKEIANFKMIDRLGEGGMGVVYRVADPSGHQYALKMMLPQAAASEQARKTFLREAQVMVQLNHQNVVRAYKFGEISDGIYYILMELCNGGSAGELMREKGGRLNIDAATQIILQSLDGLIYTHNAKIVATEQNGKAVEAKGVVHRDFKPGNIFLTASKNTPIVKVADFGLAKAFEISGLSGHTFTGVMAGTPPFMPRQQIIDYKYASPAVDVWAAAASYYYMLTGFYPKNFTGQDVYLDALNTSAIPIRQRASSIPVRLAEVIDQALVEKPKIGIQSAAELKKLISGAM